jgi:hypothetical protein
MNRTTSSSPLLTLVKVILVVFGLMIQIQAQENHTTERFTDFLDLVVPASDSCSGEDVYIFGPLEGMAQTTADSDGGIHAVIHFTPHVTAMGLTSGITYQAVGPAQIVTNMSGSGQTAFALVDIIRVTSPGSAGNLVLTHTAHVTVNASGEIIVEFDNLSTACRG